MIRPLFCSSEYMVDDRGFILSKRGKPLKPSINHSGYQIVNLMIDGKRVGLGVHTAVARAFCDGYAEGLQVNHIDGVKTNNNKENLEWVTPKENSKHAREVLGFDNVGAKNKCAKSVKGYDKKTFHLLYSFPCIMDAARYFSPYNVRRARSIQNIISMVANGSTRRHSYANCIWLFE